MVDPGMTAFETWRAMVPPPGPEQRRGPPVDWVAVEADAGTPLPADYRAYIDTYGFGWVNRLVCVLHPTTRVPHLNLLDSARAQDTPEVYEGVETPPPHPLGVGPGRLFLCATTSTGDAIHWHVDGTDPDRWPVVFRDEEGYAWQRYDMGLVAFLVELFTARIAPRDFTGSGHVRDTVTFQPDPWGHGVEI